MSKIVNAALVACIGIGFWVWVMDQPSLAQTSQVASKAPAKNSEVKLPPEEVDAAVEQLEKESREASEQCRALTQSSGYAEGALCSMRADMVVIKALLELMLVTQARR
ncbi:MAG TPA: hypothetical protein V6C52_02180 [Coleofasciculaceae cyanobacterium]